MKLSTFIAKLTSGNGRSILGGLGVLVLAGAALTAAAPAANAQQFAVGVQLGGPRYVAPAPGYATYGPAYATPRYNYAPGYWQERRAEQWRAEQWREHEWREHEAWEHHRDFGGYRRAYPY